MWTLGLISLEPPVHTRASLRSCPLPISPLCLSCLFPLEPKTQRSKKIIIINNAWSQVTPVHSGPLGARSIRPKFPTGPTGKSGPPQKVDPFFRNFSIDPLSFGPKFPEILVEWIAPVVHFKRWTSFFETFSGGPNRSNEIFGNFGWMDRDPGVPDKTPERGPGHRPWRVPPVVVPPARYNEQNL